MADDAGKTQELEGTVLPDSDTTTPGVDGEIEEEVEVGGGLSQTDSG